VSARSVRTQGNSFRSVWEIMGRGPEIRVSVPKCNASQCLDEAFGFLSRLLWPLDRWRRIDKFVPSRLGNNQPARVLGNVSPSFSYHNPPVPLHSPTPLRCHLALQRLSHCFLRPSTVGAAIGWSCERLCGLDTRQALGHARRLPASNIRAISGKR
jgi:hypothetical protein